VTTTASSTEETGAPLQLDGMVEMKEDSPPCPECGSIMVRNGACYKCLNCGTTSGCS
jgi:ribonucleoside-diphosphate reductase alpha chain